MRHSNSPLPSRACFPVLMRHSDSPLPSWERDAETCMDFCSGMGEGAFSLYLLFPAWLTLATRRFARNFGPSPQLVFDNTLRNREIGVPLALAPCRVLARPFRILERPDSPTAPSETAHARAASCTQPHNRRTC